MAEDERAEEESWVELRRFSDGILAKTVADFLEGSDIEVRLHGSAAESGIGIFGVTPDIRLLVREARLDAAHEALRALDRADIDDSPYRDSSPRTEAEVAADAQGTRDLRDRKKAWFAPMLAVLVPVGGGHFYARHGIVGFGIIASMIAATVTGHPEAILGVVAFDAIFSFFATKRLNEKRAWSRAKQGVVSVALVAATLLFGTDFLSDVRSQSLSCEQMFAEGVLRTELGPGSFAAGGKSSAGSCQQSFVTADGQSRVVAAHVFAKTSGAKAAIMPEVRGTAVVQNLGDEAIREEVRNGTNDSYCRVTTRKRRALVSASGTCDSHLEALVRLALSKME